VTNQESTPAGGDPSVASEALPSPTGAISPDPTAVAALTLNAAVGDPGVGQELREYLRTRNDVARDERALLAAQRTLVEKRTSRAPLEEEHLTAQNRHLHLQHVHDWFRLVLGAGLAALGVALLAGLGWMLYGALTDRAIIINAFTVAPTLEAQGQSGTLVAAMLIDEIGRLTKSSRYGGVKRSVADGLEDKVQVDIPEMHISLGELRRLLHENLGHRLQIRGELLEGSTGLMLTVRGTNLPAKSFSGKADELPALISRAAEYVYGHTDPILMAYYLQRAGRAAEDIAFIQSVYAPASTEDRALLLNVWGNTLANEKHLQEALVKFDASIQLMPHFWFPYYNRVVWQIGAGREEQALEAGREFERVSRRGRWFGPHSTEDNFAELDALRGDLTGAIREMRMDFDTSAGQGTGGWAIAPEISWEYALQHDPANAELFLTTNPDAIGIEGSIIDEGSLIASAADRAMVAMDVARYSEAAKQWDEWARLLAAAPPQVTQYEPLFYFRYCWPPLAYELAGRRADADAALTRVERFTNTDCYRARGDIYDHRGDWEQAQRSYAAGVEHAPSIPQAYFSWGKSFLRHREYAGAIEKLAAAHERGPRWADPLEGWGEALAAQKKYTEAIAKYTEAAEYAPQWGALYVRWGEALEEMGDRAQARSFYRKAAHLSLSDDDQRAVARHMSTAQP
jgi:tetratricopeptide (TPR) repeat protein